MKDIIVELLEYLYSKSIQELEELKSEYQAICEDIPSSKAKFIWQEAFDLAMKRKMQEVG